MRDTKTIATQMHHTQRLNAKKTRTLFAVIAIIIIAVFTAVLVAIFTLIGGRVLILLVFSYLQ